MADGERKKRRRDAWAAFGAGVERVLPAGEKATGHGRAYSS